MNYMKTARDEKKNFKKYFLWASINLRSQFAYRGAIFENVFSFIMQLLLMVSLWSAIYAQKDQINNRTLDQMIQYVLISNTITSFYVYPSIHFLSRDIKNGSIAYDLMRPLDFQLQFIFKNLGRIASSVITVLPFFFISIIVLPVDITQGNILFSFFSVLMGIITCVLFDFLLGVACFWTENSWGITFARNFAIQFLSGAFIPLDFLPKTFSKILQNYLPFSGIVYWPIQLFTTNVSNERFIVHLVVQLLWCMLFFGIGRILYCRIRSLTTINGG